MDIAELRAIFSADTRDFDRGVRGVDGRLRDAQGRFMAAGKSAQSFWSNVGSVSLGNLAANVLQRLSGQLVGFVRSAIDSAASMEGLKRGLASVAGSAEEAERQLVRLREVAKAPGLGFREAIQGSVRLQAVGLKAELAERSLMVFGNALATVGGRKEDLDGVTLALTQIVSKGKVSAEEINQIAERVPQIRKAMKDAFGTADTEVLQKMNLSTTEFIDKISQELGKIPQLTGGASNAIDNFKDSIDSALVTIGGPLLEPLGRALEAISPLLGEVAGRVAQFFSDIPQIASGIIDSLPQSFKNAFGIIMGIVQSVGSQIVGWFQQNLPLIQQTVNTVLTAIGDFWAAWGETIKTIVQTAMGVILGVIKVVMQVINGDWEGAWTSLTEIVRSVLSNLPAIIKGILSFALAAALALGKGVVNYILQGFKALPGLLLEAVKGAFKAIWALVSWVGQEAWKLGKAIVSGIWQGILSGFGAGGIVEQFRGKMQELVNAGKAQIKSESPSKVFIEIGRSIPEGLAIGIESGIARASQAMDKLLDATIRKFGTRERTVGGKPIEDAMSAVRAELERGADVLKEMAGGESAVDRVNKLIERVMANPATRHLIDSNTEAILRFTAALEDNSKTTRERRVFGEPPEEQRPRRVFPDADRPEDATRPRRVFGDVVELARRRAEEIANDLTDILGGAFNRLLDDGWRGFLQSMLESAKSVFAAIATEFLNQFLRKLLGAGQQGQSGGILGFFVSFLSKLFGGAAAGAASGGVTGSSLHTIQDSLPRFAQGGYLPPGKWGIAGEDGPEPIFAGPTGLSIFPNKGNKTTNIYVTVPPPRGSSFQQRRTLRELAEGIGRMVPIGG